MPDWSYHSVFKPLLFQLKPKTSRDFTLKSMNRLASLPFGKHVISFMGHTETSSVLHQHFYQEKLTSPVGLSGMFDPNLHGTKALSKLGFGAIEIGPVTLQPIKEKDVVRDTYNQTISYQEPFANIGVKETYKKLSKLQIDSPLIIRVKANNERDMIDVAKYLETFATLFILETNHPLDFERITRSLKKPAFLYLSENFNVTNEFIMTTKQSGIEGFSLPAGIYFENKYIFSKEIKTHHLDLLQKIRFFNQNIPIIVSGGVYEPNDAIELFNNGANLVLIHSGFVFSGPGLPKRINERLTYENQSVTKKKTTHFLGWFMFLLMGLGVLFAGILATIFGLTEVILSHDESFLGINKEAIISFNEKVFLFMSHDRLSLAGVMLSAGFLYCQLSYHGIKNNQHWAKKTYVIAGTLGFLNFFYFLGFQYLDQLHLIYNLLLLPFFISGLYFTKKITPGSTGKNLFNHKAWRKSQYGQFLFIILGGLLVVGGAVISFIGMTDIFVKEDLIYIGTTSEALMEFNQHLIPLIAHDRAGFGGALLCEGFLIMLLSMWSFREGERWVWWTLFIGGIPGFLLGVGTHFAIGYTDFLHLFPAYVLILIYMFGLLFSYPYLHYNTKKEKRSRL